MPVLIIGTYDANGVPNTMNATRERLRIMRKFQLVLHNIRLLKILQLLEHLLLVFRQKIQLIHVIMLVLYLQMMS